MGAAPLSARHLTLVVHLRRGEQEGTSREETAGAGKTRLPDFRQKEDLRSHNWGCV